MKKKALRKIRLSGKITAIFTLVMFMFTITGCKTTNVRQETQSPLETTPLITEQEVFDAQQAWGESLVQIGKIRSAGGDYKAAVLQHVENFYGYDLGPVLFKPTVVSEKAFRMTKEGALSYFTNDFNPDYPEDYRESVNPVISVRWVNAGIKIIGNVAIAMGNYYFTHANGEGENKAEHTFAYTKDESGKLRIISHHSSKPYEPK